MFKHVVVLGALAFAAPGLTTAQDNNQSPSLTDLTANEPPDSTFPGPPSLPPGLGGGVPPGCSVLATDPDDRNGPNGDDKYPADTHGNPHCNLQPASR
jgi:hypothetical protein